MEPGARVVLTHGLRVRPFSTAFLATRAAATMTYGLEVLVQEVIAATVTWPWSSSYSVPSAAVTFTLWLGAPLEMAGASEAGKDSLLASSTSPRSEEHTSELQSRENLVCRLL